MCITCEWTNSGTSKTWKAMRSLGATRWMTLRSTMLSERNQETKCHIYYKMAQEKFGG